LAPISGAAWRLLAYNLGGTTSIARLSISNVFGTPVNLVRWGTNRFAFNTTSNMLYLVKPDAEIQIASTLSNTVALANQSLALQWRLSNAGPASAAVTVSNRVPDLARFATGSTGG